VRVGTSVRRSIESLRPRCATGEPSCSLCCAQASALRQRVSDLGSARANVFGMAVDRRTVTVQLDEDLVGRARDRSGSGQAKDDAEIVEEALAVYLGMKALDEAQAESSLSEEEASQLAHDELRALRQERRGAA